MTFQTVISYLVSCATFCYFLVRNSYLLTLKCIRMWGPVGPKISFFASPVKTRKKFTPLFFL